MQFFQGLLPLGNDIANLAKQVESIPMQCVQYSGCVRRVCLRALKGDFHCSDELVQENGTFSEPNMKMERQHQFYYDWAE